MLHRRNFLAGSGLGLTLGSLPWPALGQEPGFPARPLHFIVPLTPGGSADLLARLVGQHLSQRWSQPVVVEMKPGGGTVIGSNVVAKAPADGYTLLFAANSLVINAKLRNNLPYDGLKAFEPVACMALSPQVLAVNPASPHQTLDAFLAAARAHPGTLSLGSLGPATTQHMAVEALQRETDVHLIYVPYAGGAPAVNAVLGGHVDAVLANLAEVSAHIEAGTLRPLAVTTQERLPSLRQVPTVAESGHPGFEALAWFGVAVPTGTPSAVVEQLAAGVKSALADPLLREQLVSHGLQPAYLGPRDFARYIARSYDSYSHLIDAAGITAG